MFVDGLVWVLPHESAHPLEFDHYLFLNNDSPKPPPGSWIPSHARPVSEWVSFLCSSFSSFSSCLSMFRTQPAEGQPLGARASRPHAAPLAAAEFPCDAAGSHLVGGNPIGQSEGEPWCCSTLIPVREMA